MLFRSRRLQFGGPLGLVLDMLQGSAEAVAAVYSGRQMVRASRLASLPESQRNSTVVRPDSLWSWAGLKYLVTGFIPLEQWVWPAIAWTALIAGLFAGFLAVNVLMRKQWVEHERFTFPLTILPKQLLATDASGRLEFFRNRMVWIGFAVGLPLASMKGLHYYFPALPELSPSSVSFVSYVSSPIFKAYLANVGIGIGFGIGISVSVLAIALLIETDILFSLWSMFLIFNLWNLCGKAFNFTRYAGYPWEFQQGMGAFIMYALLAAFVGRHHLANVARVILGRLPQPEREVMSYRKAALLLAASFIAIVAWGVWTKMGATAALLFFGYMFVCGVAASKIRAECGAPFAYLTPYNGMQFAAALGGFAMFHSTGMLVATIAAGFMCTSCFLLMAPAQVVEGVKVAPSPAWLVQRLAAVGQRSVNNLVDLTNLILFELGQPLHAFDAAKLSGPTIRVRRATAGETITTLDGKARDRKSTRLNSSHRT